MLPGAIFATEEVDPMWMGGNEHLPELPEGRRASADHPSDIEDTVIAHSEAHPSGYLSLLIDF